MKSICKGIGSELIIHLFRDGSQYLHIIDFENVYDVDFKHIGDINLIDENEEYYRAYSQIFPISFNEKLVNLPGPPSSTRRYNQGTYLLAKFNSLKDRSVQFYVASTTYYNLGDPNRLKKENFSYKIEKFNLQRYMSMQEIIGDWRCLLIRPIDLFRYLSLPKSISVVKMRYTLSGNLKIKISLKCLPPIHPDYGPDYDISPDWSINPENY